MDGVIRHKNPYSAKAFEAFFDKYQIPFTDEEFEKHIYGKQNNYIFHHFFKRTVRGQELINLEKKKHMYGKHNSYIFTHFFKRPVRGEELINLEKEKEGLFREIYKSEVKPIPYLPEFLSNLKDNQVKLGVATSAPRANMDLILDAL